MKKVAKTFRSILDVGNLNIKSSGPTYYYEREGVVTGSALDYFLTDNQEPMAPPPIVQESRTTKLQHSPYHSKFGK